jgi:predicted SnoaL-like aldol condensation-catalyzing enzyme
MAARLPCDLSAFSRKNEMKRTTSAENKTLVLEAFDTLFNKRDYVAAERYWSGNYLQHSAHIEPGRDGLFSLIKSLPPTLKYEPGLIVAEGEFVIIHGRFSGHGPPKNWIAADVVRIADGVLVEHWDVIEDEASRAESKSGLPMFGADFSERASTTCIANQAYRAVKTLIMQPLGSNAPSLNYADRRKRTVWPDAALPGVRANGGGVDLRSAICSRRRDQGSRCLLSRSCRRDRRAATRGLNAPSVINETITT